MTVVDRLTLDDAVNALGARREGQGYRAPCPVHGGEGFNLAINAAAAGDGPVFYCHSHQCDSRAILAAVRERAGTPPAPTRPRGALGALGAPVATYLYQTADGTPVGEVRRYLPAGEGKTFRQYAPDGTPKAPRALSTTPYRLPAVRAEVEDGAGVVFVVEGEKDVETLRGWGLVATCNAGGAERWSDAHARHLAGARDVIVLPDHDDAGRRHAAAVARSLLALADPPDVRVVHLPGLEAKGDVTEWACAGGTRPQLLELARDVLPATARTVDAACGLGPLPDAESQAPPPEATPGRVELPQAVRLLGAPDEPPPAWLVRDLIPKGEPVLVVGPDGSMKSTLALHLACAVAAGGRVFEHGAPVDAAPVLIVSGEDPRGVVANRCEAIARGHGWSRDRVLGNLHVLALAGADLAVASWRAHLVAEVGRTGAALVILDPLADLASGEENDNTERRAVVATWRALAAGGATPVLVHHAGKAGDGGKSKRERIRGASAIAAASRCTFFLEQTDAGVTVENLKQSRAEKVPAFVVAADVTADPHNRAVWTSARFTRTTQRKAALTHAEGVVLACIVERPGLAGNAVREATGLQRLAVSDALESLRTAGRIRFEPGPRNAQFWHAIDSSDATDPSVSDRFPSVSNHSEPSVSDRFPSIEGGNGRIVHALGGDFGNGDDDAAYLADERAALEDAA